MRRPRSEVGGMLAAATAQPVLFEGSPAWERSMNPEQLEVIRHDGGPIACFAGAGSGKTRALVHRVVRLVESGVEPDRIFCVTFSRAGAQEMTARIRDLGVGGAEVRTWHAFCGRVLREEGTREGSWKVDDTDRAKGLVKQAIGYKHENWVGADLSKVRSFLGMCAANLWEPDSAEAFAYAKRKFGPAAQRAVRVFQISRDLVEQAGLLTFDNMLVYVARLFAANDEVRAAWAAKFDYVLQDEAQDANLAQVTLARMLAKEHRNYMIVGDPGQAIFGFRGSDPEYLAAFPADWAGAKVVTMGRNYRSGAAIVRVANAVIEPGTHRLPGGMVAERGVEGEVRVVRAHTLDDEAGELVSFLKAQFESGRKPGEVCVLYRLNAQSRAVEEALLKERLPYVIVGGINFYERAEVKSLLGYLRVATGRDGDGEGLKRCLNAPFRFLGSAFVEKVGEEASRDRDAGPLAWVERAARRDRIQSRQQASANAWCQIIDGIRSKVEGREMPPETIDAQASDAEKKPAPWRAFDVLNYVVNQTRYIDWLEKEEGEESIETSHAANVRELLRVAGAFSDVPSFLDFVAKQVEESKKNRRKEGSNAVTMMTVHRSKGLEWPVVWVVGCNESVLPHAKGDIEEERRLAYVAFTRARDLLVASHVSEMALRTGVKTVDRSRFLEAFPKSGEELAGEEAEIAEPLAVEGPEERNSSSAPAEYAAVGAVDEVRSVVVAMPIAPPARSLAWMGEGAKCVDCGRPVAECAAAEDSCRTEIRKA